MADHLVRILTQDGTLRASAAVTTELVDFICRRQGTDPTASVALGRLATGAVLLGSLLKDDQRLALQIEGNGPLRKLQAEIDASGTVRASIAQPLGNLPPKDGRFDVAGAIGKAGFLHVFKDIGLGEPYRGTVQLVSSEVGEDLAWYLTTSEQIPSSVGLGVLPELTGGVSVAGGFLLQAMPGADETVLQQLEARIATLPGVAQLLRSGLTPLGLLEELFRGIPINVQTTLPLRFGCSCSRTQGLRLLAALPAAERTELAKETELVVTCEYCREVYRFSPDEVAAAGG